MENKLFDYHIEDARNIKNIIPQNFVDVIITSPPYWNLKNYGTNNQIGFGQGYDKYLEELTSIFNNCKDILNDKGSLWIIVDSFKKGGNIRLLPFEIADKLQKNGWHLQDIIVWQKDKTLPWSSKGKLRNIFEYILFFTKSNHFNFYIDELREVELKKWWPKYPERYNPKGKVPSRVWDLPIPTQGWGKSLVRHFCPFPPKLVENILLLTTKEDNIVLDPFAGSGSVIAQSVVMNRKAIGFDLNPEYKKMYTDRVLPFFKELWITRKDEIKTLIKKRNYLNSNIPNLRKIKYPISLIKELIKSHPSEFKDLSFIIAENKHELEYYFVFDTQNKDVFNLILKKMISKKMKKFSLTPQIEILNINEIKVKQFSDIIYLYEKGVNNYFTKQVNFNDWCTERKNKNEEKEKIPPILSNISVDVKNHLLSF